MLWKEYDIITLEFETHVVVQDNAELKPGKMFGIHSLGRKRTLVISKCSPEDAGTYICRTPDDNTSAKLSVHGN